MNIGSFNVKITINAQVGDGDTIEIGTADLPVDADANGKVTLNLEQAIREALCDHPVCANHKPVQHRDGQPPWCNACRKGKHDRGGWLPGVLVENKTGRPESILTGEQWDRLSNKE